MDTSQRFGVPPGGGTGPGPSPAAAAVLATSREAEIRPRTGPDTGTQLIALDHLERIAAGQSPVSGLAGGPVTLYRHRRPGSRGRHAAVPDGLRFADPLLPDPPGAEEQFENFRRTRRRWLSVVTFTVSLGSLYGIWAVFSKSWDWIGFQLSLAVLVPWSLYTVYLLIQKPVVTQEMHFRAVADRALDRASVDVLVPTCGEELNVLENTFLHISQMSWDGPVRVYVLDDGARPQVRALAAAYRFTYLSRPDRGYMKKAGNLNYGLAHSAGEYLVVFDADFAPSRDFLAHMIPYFADPGVGIIQTAQYFDADRPRTRNWMQRHAATVQDMFFSWIEPARETLGCSFCVGTNVGYRRAALAEAGGFPEVPGGEDIVTSWELMSAGYRTMYLPLNLAKGLCPDSFDATVSQQYRWASSSMMIIAAPWSNRTRRAFYDCRMSIGQRISFFAGVFYYLQSMLALMLAVTPSLVMLWRYPYQVGPGNYLPILPSMTGMVFLPLIQRRWRPSLLRLVMIYSAAHTLALWDTLTGSQKEWIPTNAAKRTRKGRTVQQAGWLIRAWVLLTQALAWWALARDIPVYGLPAYWPALALTAFQSAILLPLLLPGYGVLTWPRTIPSFFKAA